MLIMFDRNFDIDLLFTQKCLTKSLNVESWQHTEIARAIKQADNLEFASEEMVAEFKKKWNVSL